MCTLTHLHLRHYGFNLVVVFAVALPVLILVLVLLLLLVLVVVVLVLFLYRTVPGDCTDVVPVSFLRTLLRGGGADGGCADRLSTRGGGLPVACACDVLLYADLALPAESPCCYALKVARLVPLVGVTVDRFELGEFGYPCYELVLVLFARCIAARLLLECK